MLSGEFSSAIGGRILEYHLSPFSFHEYLDWHGLQMASPSDLYENSESIAPLLDVYMKSGGLCETSNLAKEQIAAYRNSLRDKFEWKSKRIFNSMKKSYSGDQLFTHLSRQTRSLENLVYLHLCRCFGRENVCFLRDERGHEVDFLVTRDRSFDCYQVCHFLTDDNAEREFRPLLRLLKDNLVAKDQANRFHCRGRRGVRDRSRRTGVLP